jgi:hypothetical protein
VRVPHQALEDLPAALEEAAPVTEDQWKDLVTRLIEEYRACECPYGMCSVYPHPVLREAAAATGWEPPEGQQL